MGVVIGFATRKFQRVTAIGIPLSIDLFFLSGGISIAAFLPPWLQTISHFIPTYYGTHALEMAIFYSSTEGLTADITVLAVTAAVVWNTWRIVITKRHVNHKLNIHLTL